MGKKILDLLEKYVDKMVLGFVCIICLALLWFFVFSGPYSVSFMGRKLGPGKIDAVVLQQAQRLDDKMDQPPVHKPAIQSKTEVYAAKISLSSDVIDEKVHLQLPGFGQVASIDDRSYTKPDIPDITDIQLEWYRTVSHTPIEVVDATHRYAAVKTEETDVDLITVQGTFDLSKLRRNFQNSFNSPLFKADYRSPELAKPLFADVQLERQELTAAGWSDWQVVNRSQVDPFKSIIAEIPEKMTRDYIGGVNILMSKYNGSDIQAGIVQPRAYDFASTADTWLPPSFHKEYKDMLREQWDERKDMMEVAKRNKRSGANDFREGSIKKTSRRNSREDKRRPLRNTLRKVERTMEDVFKEASAIVLDHEKGFTAFDKDIIVWANDDTIEPEKTYRYRIRVGVFNPTAGKGWLDDKQYADSVVLWSEYSEVTDEVAIEPMMYLFPLDMNKDQTAVTIKLAKFYMGKWRTADFDVIPGELIGSEVDATSEQADLNKGGGFEMDGFNFRDEEAITVDFTTDVLLVDVVPMTDLMGSTMLRQRHYSDVLYTSDGNKILRMPTKKTNWPSEIQDKFNSVRASEEVPIQLLSRGSSGDLGSLFSDDAMGGGFMGEF